VRSTEKGIDKADLPDFMWLLRDHHLTFSGLPKDEMMEKLDPSAVSALESSFAEIECFPLPRPLHSEEKFTEMDTMKYEELDQAFRDEFVVLERNIMDSVKQVRKLGDDAVTGEGLAGLLEMYLGTMFRPGGVIEDIVDLPTQKDMLVRIAGERSIGAAVQEYKRAMEGLAFPVSDAAMEIAHTDSLAAAIKCFDAGVVLDERERGEWLVKLEDQVAHWEAKEDYIGQPPRRVRIQELVGGLYAELREANLTASKEACDRERERVMSPLVAKAAQEVPDFKGPGEWDAAVEVALADYDTSSEAVGPCKAQVRQQMEEACREMESKTRSKLLQAQIAEMVKEQVDKGLKDADAKAAAALQEAEAKLSQQQQELAGQIKAQGSTLGPLETRLSSTEADLGAFVARLGGLDDRLGKAQEETHKSINTLRTQVTTRLEEESHSAKEAGKRLEELLATHQTKLAGAESDLNSKLEQSSQVVTAAMELKMSALTAELESKIKSLSSQVSESASSLDAKLEESREAASAQHATTEGLSLVEASMHALEERSAASERTVSSRLAGMEKDLGEKASAASAASASFEKLQSEVEKDGAAASQIAARLGKLEEGTAACQSKVDQVAASCEANANLASNIEGDAKAGVAGVEELRHASTEAAKRVEGELGAAITLITEMKERMQAVEAKIGASQEHEAGAKSEDLIDLGEKIKAVETRQAKVTKHIVELSKRVSASAEDARGHEDEIRRHITETVAPLWETMNMLSRRIDCIM